MDGRREVLMRRYLSEGVSGGAGLVGSGEVCESVRGGNLV